MRFIDIDDTTPLSLRSILRLRKAIGRICRKYGVPLCFLHGSLAADRHAPLSDVDIAVFAPHLTFDRQWKFQSALQTLLGRDDVDLARLDRASTVLGMQVLTKGLPLYVKDRHVLAQFRYETFRTYLDGQHLRRTFADYVTEAVL